MFGQEVLRYVEDYGYFGLFGLLVFGIVGLPVPDETLLTFSGYLAYKGHVQLVPTYATAWAGTMCGISASYILGRYVGCRLITKYGRYVHATEERLGRVEKWFERSGKWLLVIGYFIPGVRHVVAIVAGGSKLPFHHFALFAYAGGLVWTATFITLGYAFGDAWDKVEPKGNTVVYIAVGAAVALAAAFFIGRRFLRKGRA